MATIKLHTTIKAPIQKVFDLSRDIDFHQKSASHTHEKAIAGTTYGLINFGETVTWRGKHFGLYLQHQSKITAFDRPNYFVDEMIRGHFKSFKHEHIFETIPEGTLMTDILTYETPFGMAGQLFDNIALKQYLTTFLVKRNQAIQLALK